MAKSKKKSAKKAKAARPARAKVAKKAVKRASKPRRSSATARAKRAPVKAVPVVEVSKGGKVKKQVLAGEHEHELIFRARKEDFHGPSTEEILKDVGLTPADVKELLDGEP